jgi:cell division protein FtsL
MDNGVMSFFRSRKVLVTVAIVAIVTMSMSMVVMFM